MGSNPTSGTGGVAQMVERVLCMHEAAGSIPAISINFHILQQINDYIKDYNSLINLND